MSPEDEAKVQEFLPLAALWLHRCEITERSLATMFLFVSALARQDELEKLQVAKLAFQAGQGGEIH